MEKTKFCPLINGECLKEKCSMALAAEHTGKCNCSLGVICTETEQLQVVRYKLKEQLEELNKKLDLRDKQLEHIARELKKNEKEVKNNTWLTEVRTEDIMTTEIGKEYQNEKGI